MALVQAAAYIQATGSTLARYSAIFRKRHAELLTRGEAADHPATIAATLGLALSRLEVQTTSAVGLLKLLACLAPEPVPLALLLSNIDLVGKVDPDVAATLVPLLRDQLAADDAVAALRRYSLITLAADGTAQVHGLVQAVTLAQMPAEVADAWRQAAVVLTEAAIPVDTSLPANWPACAALLPHAHAVLGPTSSGMWSIALYLFNCGSYSAARDQRQEIADAGEQTFGPGHLGTLKARHNAAVMAGWTGAPAQARDLLAEVVASRQRVLGPEHPHTLITRHQLAVWTGEAGYPAQARDLCAELLPVQERVVGPEDRDTLATRLTFATETGQAGDAARARDLCTELLPVRERVLGTEDADTLLTRSYLAHWTGRAGDPARARDLYAELLPIQERTLGSEHPATLATRQSIASWTGEAGDPAQARDLFAELLPIEEGILGSGHQYTLATRANLAYWTGQAEGGGH